MNRWMALMKTKRNMYLLDWAVDIVIAGIIVYIITTFAFQNMYVIGGSMDPTLRNGEVVLVNKLTYLINQPSRYDIIAFKHTNMIQEKINFVKRIIGLPGDKIDIIDDEIYVNDQILKVPINEKHKHGIMKAGSMSYPAIVPEDSYFVLGDNQANSVDSRYQEVGMIPKKEVIGKICFRIWPLWQVKVFH